MASLTGTRPPFAEATLRFFWRKHKCEPSTMTSVVILGRTMPVASETKEVWEAFNQILLDEPYPGTSAWTYVCRFIRGTTTPSTHSYGIAVDLDPKLNPFISFGTWDDTVFTPETVQRLLAVRTNNGKQVFAWGGQWGTKQDLMHWYIVCKPSDILTGIDYTTVMNITPDELEFLRQLKAAVDAQKSQPYGAMFETINLIRQHRPGGPLAPQTLTVDLSDYELVKKST